MVGVFEFFLGWVSRAMFTKIGVQFRREITVGDNLLYTVGWTPPTELSVYQPSPRCAIITLDKSVKTVFITSTPDFSTDYGGVMTGFRPVV